MRCRSPRTMWERLESSHFEAFVCNEVGELRPILNKEFIKTTFVPFVRKVKWTKRVHSHLWNTLLAISHL